MKADVESLAQQIADKAWAELGPKIDTLKADWDAHRRQLQARNTELVEENRRLRALLVGVVRLTPGQSWCDEGNAEEEVARRDWEETDKASALSVAWDRIRALSPAAPDAERSDAPPATGVVRFPAGETVLPGPLEIEGMVVIDAADAADGVSDACKTRTVHGCWCDLPSGHDGPHRSYDDPEPDAKSRQHNDSRPPLTSTAPSAAPAKCGRCGGTGTTVRMCPECEQGQIETGACPSCGGSGAAPQDREPGRGE